MLLAPTAHECVKFVFVRAGSAILHSEFGMQDAICRRALF